MTFLTKYFTNMKVAFILWEVVQWYGTKFLSTLLVIGCRKQRNILSVVFYVHPDAFHCFEDGP